MKHGRAWKVEDWAAPTGDWSMMITPAAVMRPAKPAANHSAPCGPAVMLQGG